MLQILDDAPLAFDEAEFLALIDEQERHFAYRQTLQEEAIALRLVIGEAPYPLDGEGFDGLDGVEAQGAPRPLAKAGDAIVQTPSDTSDTYRVAAASFKCTYEIAKPAKE